MSFNFGIIILLLILFYFYIKYLKQKYETYKNNTKKNILNLVHDLRSPLTSIIGFVEIIRDNNFDSAKNSEYLDIIKSESERMAHMISEILAGKQVLSQNRSKVNIKKKLFDYFRYKPKDNFINFEINESINCCKEIHSICTSIKILADKKKISLNFDEKPKVFVQINKNNFWRIILNILENAVKYNNHNGSINISVREQDGFGIIKIADNGIGVAKEDINKIFKKGYVVDANNSDNTSFGIGLSSVKHLLMLCGGRIKFESELNKGSVVTVWLPISNQFNSRSKNLC